MFSNLSKGSVLYGLDKRDGVTLFTATVDNVSIALPNMMNMPLGQTMLNIKATVNGKQGDFLNIPSTNAIYVTWVIWCLLIIKSHYLTMLPWNFKTVNP